MTNETKQNIKLDSITACDALCGLRSLPDSSIDCCITSPPYYAMRDYEADGQIGLERSPDEYILRLVDVFAEVYRVLKPQGVMWVVIGDSYCGAGKGAATDPANAMLYKQGSNRGTLSRATAFKYETSAKRKDLLGIPWMLAFALRDFGWYLRQDIIWHKSNPMPESVTDRCTRAHEYVFLFSKRSRYYFVPMLEDAEGYDGRKATATRGSAKYRGKRVPGNSQQSIVQGGERWRFKNLHRSNPNTLHLRRLTGGGAGIVSSPQSSRCVETERRSFPIRALCHISAGTDRTVLAGYLSAGRCCFGSVYGKRNYRRGCDKERQTLHRIRHQQRICRDSQQENK